MVPPRRDIVAVPDTNEMTIYLIGGRTSGTVVSDLVQTFELSDIHLDVMIPDDTINGDTIQVDLSEHFSHVDGSGITYEVCIDEPDTDTVQASVDGNMLTVTGLLPGDAEVRVLAESGEDQMGDVFQVNVETPTSTIGIDESCEMSPALHVYPNPYRGMTTLAYSVRSQGSVRLEVYDLLGRRVVIPLYEYRVPGEYEYQLQTGELESGIYFCDLTTTSQRVTVKLMVEQ